jgi:hypothetical protein
MFKCVFNIYIYASEGLDSVSDQVSHEGKNKYCRPLSSFAIGSEGNLVQPLKDKSVNLGLK